MWFLHGQYCLPGEENWLMGLKLNKKPLGQEDGSADKSAYHKNLTGSVQSQNSFKKKKERKSGYSSVTSNPSPSTAAGEAGRTGWKLLYTAQQQK